MDHFALLIDRYDRKLFYYIKRLINIPDMDIEDLVQEAFIKAYQNLNDFDQSLKFSSWIYRIAHNETISYYRKHKRQIEYAAIDPDKLLDRIVSDFKHQEKVDRKILTDQISQVVHSLPEKYRDVLILKYYEDKDYTEISNILKRPMGTVATLMNRAKAKFKQSLQQHDIKLSDD